MEDLEKLVKQIDLIVAPKAEKLDQLRRQICLVAGLKGEHAIKNRDILESLTKELSDIYEQIRPLYYWMETNFPILESMEEHIPELFDTFNHDCDKECSKEEDGN